MPAILKFKATETMRYYHPHCECDGAQIEVDDAEGARLLQTFPENFVAVPRGKAEGASPKNKAEGASPSNK